MFWYFFAVGGFAAVAVVVAGGVFYYFRPSSGTHANPSGAVCTVETLQRDVERSRVASIGTAFVSPRERAVVGGVEIPRMRGDRDDVREFPEEDVRPALVRRYVRLRGNQSGNTKPGVALANVA